MKLAEILARDLGTWPSDLVLVQGAGGSVYEAGGGDFIGFYDLAEDWSLAEVTRPQWQAEMDRMKAMKSIELKDTEGLCEALKDWEAAGKPMGDGVTITEPAVSYEQELWDKVASSAIGGIVASSAFHNYQNFQGNVANAVDFASQVADAFMAERAKRVGK